MYAIIRLYACVYRIGTYPREDYVVMGQNQPEHSHHAPQPHLDAKLSDPVCGMRVTEDSTHHMEHRGKPYYFCSTKCLGKFRGDPDKYRSEERRVGKERRTRE